MELMVEEGNEIPDDVEISQVKKSLDEGPDGSHDGFGGVATTLAILTASPLSSTLITILEDTYAKVFTAMRANESIDDESLSML